MERAYIPITNWDGVLKYVDNVKIDIKNEHKRLDEKFYIRLTAQLKETSNCDKCFSNLRTRPDVQLVFWFF